MCWTVRSGGENGGGRCVVGRALASDLHSTLAFARGNHAVAESADGPMVLVVFPSFMNCSKHDAKTGALRCGE
jgi:hypothetical protein